MYFNRNIEEAILESAETYPVITITGPRQSGKTTLIKHLFKDKAYYNLEFPDVMERIKADPRAFFSANKEGAIIDEVQKLPELMSYIQGIVDEEGIPGMFILTGSNHFSLMKELSQSLSGRTALFNLLPFALNEIESVRNHETDKLILAGFYPAIFTKKIKAYNLYQNYYHTYIERDVRNLINVKNISDFQKFVKLCAGRIGQIFNAASLADEVGVSVPTIKAWLSVLEASFVAFTLPPWYDKIKKRLIKSPKLYFYDTGLASYILGIETPEQLSRDPLRGNLFENLIVTEFIKRRYNKGRDFNFYFFRDNHGTEVDLIIPEGNAIKGVEIKSAQTFNNSFLKGLKALKKIYPERNRENILIYQGESFGFINDVDVRNYLDI